MDFEGYFINYVDCKYDRALKHLRTCGLRDGPGNEARLQAYITSGKLWLKMRRMNVISPVLHIFVSSLRLKHRMSMIQRALDSPVLVDYFSYPHHG